MGACCYRTATTQCDGSRIKGSRPASQMGRDAGIIDAGGTVMVKISSSDAADATSGPDATRVAERSGRRSVSTVRRTVVSAALALALVSIGSSAAFAGEITGSGVSLKPLQANSDCAFSGLDAVDGSAIDPLDADDAVFGRTQSFGQLISQGLTVPGVPGVACNGHLSPAR
jgi:hypothetical protein